MDKIAVVLDTNVFGNPDTYNFNNIKLTSIAKAISNSKNIDLFLPNICLDEIQKHIKFGLINDKNIINQNATKYFKRNLDENIYEEIKQREIEKLDDFLVDNDIIIIQCEYYANIEQVITWYFNMEYPFEEKKKDEFPDAMIVSAIINYFPTKDYNKVYIISDDNGFQKAIKSNTTYKMHKNIDELLKEIFKYDTSEITKIKNLLNKEKVLYDIDNYYLCSPSSSDILDVEIDNAGINSIEILNVDNKKGETTMTFEVDVNLDLSGDIQIEDIFNSIYDKEVPECSCIIVKHANKLLVKNIKVYFSLKEKHNECKKISLLERGYIEFADYLSKMEIQEN